VRVDAAEQARDLADHVYRRDRAPADLVREGEQLLVALSSAEVVRLSHVR
jgi:hypothetical protein